MKRIPFLVVFLTLALVATEGSTHEKVVVIPLHSQRGMENVITVAKKGGDFDNVISAIDSITGESATNPYVIYIGPGIYDHGDRQLIMKNFVSIIGAGRGITTLKWVLENGTSTTMSGILGADNSQLSQLTIEMLNGGTYGIGILNNGTSPTISDVEIVQTSFSRTTIAIWNTSEASPKISSSSINLKGLQYNYGIYNTFSSPVIEDVTVEVALGSLRNIAIRSDASSPVITNVRAKSESSDSGATVIGLQCLSTSRPSITNSSFEAEGTGGEVYGMTLNAASSGARIVNSRIIGGVNDEAAGTQCRGLYDENLAFVGC